MSQQKIKESLVFKKDVVLKSASDDELEELEYLFSKTLFNEDGKVTNEKQYNVRGELMQEYIYKYNESGFLVEEILQEEDGMIAVHKTWDIDDKGKILREFHHYMDETYDTVTFYYDDQGKLIKKETIDPDGDLESIEQLTWDGDHITQMLMQDADGDVLSEKKTRYDDKGNIIEVEEYDGSVDDLSKKEIEYYPSGNQKQVLTYNDAGQLVEKVQMKEDAEKRIVQIVEETTARKSTINFTFDGKGNIIHQEEFNRNGELVGKVSRMYDENNRLVSSTVFIHGDGRGLSRNYTLRQEYVYY
ncbi:MAG: hypothetical protein ABR597_00875 [Bacteroidales bacterium]